jgi:hypothetical protein
MGRRTDGSNTQQKDNSIENLVGNEQNGYSVPDSSKKMINVTNEPSDAHKKVLQRGNHGRNH